MDATTKSKIQKLVAEAKTDKALEEWGLWADSYGDDDMKNQIVLLKGQYNAVKREENQGLLSRGEAQMSKNRISNAILTSLPATEAVSTAPKTSSNAGQNTPSVSNPVSVPPTSGGSASSNNIVLFLASNPSSTAKLQLEKEFQIVFAKLQNSKFTVKSEFAATPRAMQTAIIKYKPRIIHFSGHGLGKSGVLDKGTDSRGVGDDDDGAGLVLEDESGNKKVVPTEKLKEMFRIFDKYKIKIETVVFNACHSRIQADAINEFVDYVIGYSSAISDKAAIQIADAFYDNLTIEDNVEMAFDLTRNIVGIDGLKEEQLMSLMTRND